MNEFIIKNGYFSQGNSTITGSLIVTQGVTGSLQGTSSYALTASFALNGGGGGIIDTGSLVTTASFNQFTSSYNTGSFTGSFIGVFNGTSSWSNQSLTASYVILSQTASYYGGSVISSSYSATSSNSLSSSYALTASYISNISIFPYIGSAIVTGSLIVTGSVIGNFTGSLDGTSSWASNSLTASYTQTQISESLSTFKNDNYLDATSSIQTQLNRLPFWIAGHNSISPADSTTYAIGVFFSIVPQASTSGGASSWKFPFAHTITKVVVVTRYAVAGSNEASALSLRNQTTTTDSSIGNLDYSKVSYVGAAGFVQEFTVSIAVNNTDYYWLKEVTPAWGTNPTNVAKTIYFY